MKLLKVVSVTCLLQACDTPEINTTVVLDSVIEHTPTTVTEHHKSQIHEFNVDLLRSNPTHVSPVAYVSDQDTYAISLKTLDYLNDEKEFILIQADQIIHSGTPKVIAPKGYSVRLKVTDNQVIAVMKSTTSAEAPAKPRILNLNNNDIVVGDMTTIQHLLTVGMMKDLSFNGSCNGSKQRTTPLHQYLAYPLSPCWNTLFSKTRIGMDTTWAAAISRTWYIHEKTSMNISVQHLYNSNKQQNVQAASLSYVTSLSSWGSGQLTLSSTLGALPQLAVGLGLGVRPLHAMQIHLHAIQTRCLWCIELSFRLDL